MTSYLVLLILLNIVICSHEPVAPPPPNLAPPTIVIDLDEPQHLTDISYHTLESFSPTKFIKIISKNPKSVISISSKRTTIVPYDDVLINPDSLSKLSYLEIKHSNTTLTRLNHAIPLTPCLDTFSFNGKGQGTIKLTNRIQVQAQVSLGIGGDIGLGTYVNLTSIRLSMGSKVSEKVAKARLLDMTVACTTSENWTTRIFTYLPIIETDVYARRLVWDKETGEVEFDEDEEDEDEEDEDDGDEEEGEISGMVRIGRKRMLSNGLVKTLCKRGTEKEMGCYMEDEKVYTDEYGNQFSWSDV
ncbi:uncharacterized protein J8A68_006092 [[Candida] subhashii]|uniref:Uncharacterized protein n=1 Tax=[Candida] subhashii TaxID=561895 RepID=A0A8J5QDS1_9ASCO|nr:uncharacterized protein J8A68_006092 [[Candida] subhashii]KAG7660397.1 hypothetical protein J8A68_006092 [[Candida] subhashii]